MTILARQTRFILSSLLIFLAVLSPLGSSAQVQPAPRGHYDELFAPSGDLRAPYDLLAPDLESLNSLQETRFLKESRVRFQGDNALSPVPRILNSEEAQSLQNGVEQRARALVAFLKDLHSGQKSYAEVGIIPEVVVQRIISRAGESGYAGQIDPSTIAFMYGPDIIRDTTGNWRVIEDNPGFIGGIGDLQLAYEMILEKYPQLRNRGTFVSPDGFYQSMGEGLKRQAALRGGKAIVYMAPPYADKEDQRIRKIFAKMGIETVTPNTRIRLKITASGVFTFDSQNPSKRPERVGYLFQNGEHAWLDRSLPASRQRFLIEMASNFVKDNNRRSGLQKSIEEILSHPETLADPQQLDALEKLVRLTVNYDPAPVPGLLEAIFKGKVGSNYSPGIDFIGDKEFYVYVESLIRFYLNEEPILKNIPTQKLTDLNTGKINHQLIKEVLKNPKAYVLKKVDGRGGDAVWVGAKLKTAEMSAAIDQALKNPDVYILQKYTPLSVLNGQIVDLRSITAILPDQIIVSQVPWGRGLPMNGNGKVNLSDQGREVTVLIENRTPQLRPFCQKIYSVH